MKLEFRLMEDIQDTAEIFTTDDRRPYKRPVLVKLGAIVEMTQAGSGPFQEFLAPAVDRCDLASPELDIHPDCQ